MADNPGGSKAHERLIDITIGLLVLAIIVLAVSFVRSCNQIATGPEVVEEESTTVAVKPDKGSEPSEVLANLIPKDGTMYEEGPVTVEILNGLGKSGLAFLIRDYLLATFNRRIDVLNYQNAVCFEYQETMIVDRRAPFYDDKVKNLQALTGITNIVSQRYECGVDASIILGYDWEKYFPEVANNIKKK